MVLARYFDPKLGRFLTQDSYLGQIDEPPSLHRYLYANANPLFFTDPTGHYSRAEFVSDLKWGKDFIVAFGSDLAQNAPERGKNVLKAIGRNASNVVLETGANIHDAAVLGFEVTTGVDTGIGLRSSVAQASGQAIASGDPLAHLDVTQQIGIDTAANIATFGIYGTAKEQYSALRDYSQGKASIEQVEERLANAAGANVVNLGLTAGFLKATTGSVRGPDLGLAAKNVVESASQLPSKARAAFKGGLERLHETIGRNDLTTLGRIEPPRGTSPSGQGIYPASLQQRLAAFKQWRAGGGKLENFPRFVGAHRPGSRGTTLYPSRSGFRSSSHGNRLTATGPHDVYAVRDATSGRVLHFGETGRGFRTRGLEWARILRERYGLETRVEHLKAVQGKGAARTLESRYIRTYEKLFGHKPGYVDPSGTFVPIQKTYH